MNALPEALLSALAVPSAVVSEHSPLIPFSESLVQQARAESLASAGSVVAVLERLTGADARTVVQGLGVFFGMPVFDTADMLGCASRFDLLPLSKALQKGCAVLTNADGACVATVADPFNSDVQTWLQTLVAGQPRFTLTLALAADIQAYLSIQENSARAVDTMAIAADAHNPDNASANSLSFTSVSESASPAVRLVNSTLYDGLKAGASDIHLESTNTGLAVKYRLDGVLDQVTSVKGLDVAEQVISRLKVLAELDIAERRIPQDGSFRVHVGGRDIDLRVSIIPSIHGEDAVIRILDKRAMVESYGALTLEALGFDAPSLVTLRALSQAPYGMLLVTGPTGSGKTTTLYAALTEIHTGREKIVTIEDPVEYQIGGILQIPVNEKKGLTFAKGLRSILRHDPDKIMIGEIRDTETAEIAVQSALTGHLVLTTVHANNVFDVFGRFTHMGIDPYALVSAMNGIWSQRLVRLNCPNCAKEFKPSPVVLAQLGIQSSEQSSYRFMAGEGCGDCRGTGYKGRKALAEILVLNDELREMIVDKTPIRQIKEAAYSYGTRSLRQAALGLIKSGETSCAEILRVTLNA